MFGCLYIGSGLDIFVLIFFCLHREKANLVASDPISCLICFESLIISVSGSGSKHSVNRFGQKGLLPT